ncbi:hypothetical protein LTR67_003156 [Exophiala xenobiotica]
MASFKGSNTLTMVLFLMSLFSFSSASGLAQIYQGCGYDVWCAVVQGYGPGSTVPQSERPPPDWIKQAQGSFLMDQFPSHPHDIGVAVMCTRNKDASPILVTQVEYTWEPENGKTWFDEILSWRTGSEWMWMILSSLCSTAAQERTVRLAIRIARTYI